MNSLKENRWRQRFEATKAALSDDQKYYGAPKDQTPRPEWREYSGEEYERIVDLRASGKTWVEIGETLGRSTSSVWSKGTSLLREAIWQQRFDRVAQPQARVAHQSFGEVAHQFTAEEDRRLEKVVSWRTNPDLRYLQPTTPRVPDKRINEPWSEAEKQKMRLAISHGKHVSELQQLFPSRSLAALRAFSRKLQLSVPNGFFRRLARWTPAQDADLLRLREGGESWEAIGAIVDKKPLSYASRWYRLHASVRE